MTLIQEFKTLILSKDCKQCIFNPNEEGTEVGYILANNEKNVKLVQKYFNCTKEEAEDLINMPLLNTVWQSKKANTKYYKTEDIKLIDKELLFIAYYIIWRWYENRGFVAVSKLDSYMFSLKYTFDGLQILDNTAITEIIKQIQYDFKRKIKGD